MAILVGDAFERFLVSAHSNPLKTIDVAYELPVSKQRAKDAYIFFNLISNQLILMLMPSLGMFSFLRSIIKPSKPKPANSITLACGSGIGDGIYGAMFSPVISM